MSLIAGSYQRFIWGFKLKPLEHDCGTLTLTPLFSYPSHISPITSVACSGPAAASGGADDTIHLYDLPSAASLGSLLDHNHTASITALSFYTSPSLSFPRNLISAAADGSVAIFDTDPFVLLKSFRPHKKAINDLAIHPSGKLALTVSRDECLAMLNLVRGRRSFCCRLGHESSIVKFDSGEERFFMVVSNKVGVHQAEDAKLLCEMESPSRKRILSACPGEVFLFFLFFYFNFFFSAVEEGYPVMDPVFCAKTFYLWLMGITISQLHMGYNSSMLFDGKGNFVVAGLRGLYGSIAALWYCVILV